MQSNFLTLFDFKTKIWRVHAHETQPLLLVETRDESLREVRFSMLDLRSNEVLWNDLDLGDDWWRAFEGMNDQALVLHGFEDANNPVRKGIFVFDLLSGMKLYSDDNAIFHQLEQNFIIESVFADDKEYYSRVELSTGNKTVLAEYTYGLPQIVSQVLNPILVDSSDALFSKVSDFIRRYQPITSTIVCAEYLESDNHICIAYTSGEEGNLDHKLMVVNSSADMILSEVLAENLQGIALGSFFTTFGYLVYVKDNSCLCYYPIV